MTHDESIALNQTSLGAKFTPELKAPEVTMPFDGDYTQEKYADPDARRAIKTAGMSDPGDVFAQSFDLNDIKFWIKHRAGVRRTSVCISTAAMRRRVSITRRPETWKPAHGGARRQAA